MLRCSLALALCLALASGSYQAAGKKIQADIIGQAGQESLYAQDVYKAPAQQTFYRPTVAEKLPTVPACQEVKCHLALTVILDSSGSVGYADFQKELQFAKTLLEILAVKAYETGLAVCSGIIRYSTEPEVLVSPCCNETLCSVVGKVDARGIPYVDGSTNTAGALKVARQMLQAAASYNKIALLITDGHSNTGGSPVTIAKEMRFDDEIHIVALGVTDNINPGELMEISGTKEVVKIKDFDDFSKLASLLLDSNSMTSDQLYTDLEEICDGDLYVSRNETIWGNWTEWSDCEQFSDSFYGRSSYPAKCKKIQTRDCYHCGTAKCEGATQQEQDCECVVEAEPPGYYDQYSNMNQQKVQPQPPGGYQPIQHRP